MKVWEETWRLDAEHPTTSGAEIVWEGSVGAGRSVQFGKECGPTGESWHEANEQDVARARLASAAPDMARVLLEIEWQYRERSDPPQCPVCLGERPRDSKPWRGGHVEGCSLEAALIKAGVRAVPQSSDPSG